MRLNFSGSPEDEIREGVRRIGRVVAEQVALYGTITREHELAAAEVPEPPESDRGAEILPLRRQEER